VGGDGVARLHEDEDDGQAARFINRLGAAVMFGQRGPDLIDAVREVDVDPVAGDGVGIDVTLLARHKLTSSVRVRRATGDGKTETNARAKLIAGRPEQVSRPLGEAPGCPMGENVAPMNAREVRFRSGDVELVGEIISPAGLEPSPGVVLLHAAGWGERRFYRAHAEAFAEAGIASLIFDRRGEGQSSGPRVMAIPVLAGDASAAWEFIREQPEIAPERAGLWGYSNGAWVASLAAEQVQPAFLVLAGAAGVSPAEAEVYRRTEDLRRQGIGGATLAAVERAWTILFGSMVTGEWDDARDAELRQLAAAIRGNRELAELPVPEFVKANPLLSSVPPFDSPLLASPGATVPGASPEMGYDPIPSLESVSCPVLVVMAEHDANVPVAESVRRFESVAAGRAAEFRVEVIPGAQHSFTVAGYTDRDGMREPLTAEQFLPGYLAQMAQWIAATAGAAARES
jgi:dienelactone hydrolase